MSPGGPLPFRRRLGFAAPLVTLLVAAACSAGSDVPASSQGPTLQAGYDVRSDSARSDPGHLRVAEADRGLRVTTGPAGIAWRPSDVVEAGDFQASATFVLHDAPVGYREAYGILVGGADLHGPNQSYLYFLVRPTGAFTVRRRTGRATETVVDWTDNDAVQPMTTLGDQPANALAVQVVDGDTRFLVNGTEVYRMPTAEARPYGLAGLRINHRLELSVEGWSLGAPPL